MASSGTSVIRFWFTISAGLKANSSNNVFRGRIERISVSLKNPIKARKVNMESSRWRGISLTPKMLADKAIRKKNRGGWLWLYIGVGTFFQLMYPDIGVAGLLPIHSAASIWKVSSIWKALFRLMAVRPSHNRIIRKYRCSVNCRIRLPVTFFANDKVNQIKVLDVLLPGYSGNTKSVLNKYKT